ncbi:shikimate kinase [Desulfoluna butyratoxydans]|uniref:Shikimate kinase n=1 Tax=Desulfoluna butyratoxydans TaxID=231438 RepID=A0A4U8YJS7_9BACT|nr:shikimate kinase [Desulfoluna butyratoxydans]VFQ43667.1 shikimate kinase/gluconokinase [Desulfoluna butyratoxydans]
MIEKNVVLTGMPAAGKSTVGVILAKRLGLNFTDSDVYIQTCEGRRLSEIIREEGLDRFKEIEEGRLCEMAVTGTVIATGGSVIYGQRAMDHLASGGVIVYLHTPLSVLMERLSDLNARGVVIQPGMSVESLYQERHPLYMGRAHIVIPTDGLTPSGVADAIHEALIKREGEAWR